MARFITEWATRTPQDRVLEPSCGEAIFLLEAGERLRTLAAEAGRPGPAASQLMGVDLHSESVRLAETELRANDLESDLSTGDFFEYAPTGQVDAVIGNPPYVRYQDFSGSSRNRAIEAALASGVRLSSLASSWAAFTVHATSFLREGGRMGLVLPAELMSANYAGPVRQFLLDHFGEVTLVLFTERVFPGVQEEVVLLLASEFTSEVAGTNHFTLRQLANANELQSELGGDLGATWVPQGKSSKWTNALGFWDIYADTIDHPEITGLESWGRIALGAVSGRNSFFALNEATANEYDLRPSDLLPLSPPGSQHLRALSLTEDDVAVLTARGKRTALFAPTKPSVGARAYIAHGESLEIDQAYKCRIRTPWWRVPLQQPADLLITYMNADTVALCSNEARVRHLNSVHGLFLSEDVRDIDPVYLALASCGSVTRLGAEIVGRSYGGGLLKVEPREAAQLPVPSPDLVRSCASELGTLLPRAVELLRQGRRDEVQTSVDEIFAPHLDLDAESLSAIRQAAHTLFTRRKARARQASS